MRTSDSPFEYLAVIPPAAPQGNIRSQDVTADRLARHVAVVFGVDVPENPAERTWVADYERLRVNEISRGSLTSASRSTNDGTLDVIAMATLQKYGPDNKSALVLTGCEVLFNSVLPVFRDVLGILGVSSDTEPVANVTIFAAWSLLVAETFRAQPALTAAAMKARAIQARSYLEWGMVPTPLDLAPSERPRETRQSRKDTHTSPQRLSVLDGAIPQELSLLQWSQYGKDASNQRLVRSLVDNWCHYILDSADQAVAWVTPSPTGHRSDAYFPLLDPVNAFASDVLALSPHVQPLFDDASKTGTPVPFQKSELNKYHELTDRILPRMYAAPEISKLEIRSQRALLMTHMTILRVFRNGDDFRSTYLEDTCRKHAKEIVQIAKRLWGETDLLTVMLETSSVAMELSDSRDTYDPETMRHDQTVLIDGFAMIYAAWQSGVVPDSVWIRLVNEHSAELRQSIERIAKHDRQQAQTLRETHRTYWRSATTETGLRGEWSHAISNLDNEDQLPATGMNSLFHNYLALPFRSDDEREVLEALKFSNNKLIPLRKKVMGSRMSDRPYRISLQTTARPVHDLLIQRRLSAKDDAWLITTAAEMERQLREDTELGRYFFDNTREYHRDINQSDLNFLGSLLRFQVSLLERGSHPSPEFDLLLTRVANTLEVAWHTYAQLLRQSAEYSGIAASVAPDARRFVEFRDYERRVQDMAESSTPTISRHTIERVNDSLRRARVSRESIEP